MVQILILDASGNLKWKYNHFVFNDASIRIPFNLILNKGVYTINVNLNGYKSKAIQIIGL
jgi:FAD synthase